MFTNIKLLLIFVSLLTGLMLIQCGKDKITQSTPDSTLIGQWQWVNSVGGIAGVTRTPETEGYDVILSFYLDSTFTIITISESGESWVGGIYSIKYDKVWEEPDSVEVITMNSMQSIIDIVDDTLYLSNICIDCFGHTYVRITE